MTRRLTPVFTLLALQYIAQALVIPEVIWLGCKANGRNWEWKNGQRTLWRGGWYCIPMGLEEERSDKSENTLELLGKKRIQDASWWNTGRTEPLMSRTIKEKRGKNRLYERNGVRWQKTHPFYNWRKICCTERLGWKTISQEVKAGNWKGKWETRSETNILNMEKEFGKKTDLILTLLCISIMTLFGWYGIFPQEPCLFYSQGEKRQPFKTARCSPRGMNSIHSSFPELLCIEGWVPQNTLKGIYKLHVLHCLGAWHKTLEPDL